MGWATRIIDRYLAGRRVGPWDPTFVNTTQAFVDAFKDAVALQRRPCRVLDVGCGRGAAHDEKRLRMGTVDTIVGVDPIPEVSSNPFIHFAVQGSVYELPFSANAFNVVACDYVLEHLESPDIAFREAWRVLQPGGFFVFRTPNIFHYVPLVALWLQRMGYRHHPEQDKAGKVIERWPVHYRANSARRIRKLAAGTGFRVVRLVLADGGPHYLHFFAPFYVAGILHQYLVNKCKLLIGFRGNIICTLQRQ